MNKIGTVIFKPDTLKYSFDEIFIDELKKLDILVKFRKIMNLDSNHMEYIYPDKIGTDKEKYALYSISHGSSMLLLLEGDDLYRKLKDFKGNWNLGGIRKKYLYPGKEKLEELGFKGSDLEMKLAENRIHSTDNYFETIKLLSGLLNFDEIEILKNINFILYKDIYFFKIQKYLLTYIIND